MRTFLLILAVFLAIPTAKADEYGFSHWLYGFKQRAAAQGISQSVLANTVNSLEYLPRVIELDQKQPEHKITFAKYKKNILTKKRIEEGRKFFKQYRAMLNRVSQTYGVQPQYIVALWGIETSYGKITGGFDVLSALATLAYEGRRASFFENELIGALKILQNGHAGTDRLIGSWAGAMGQCQFMPSSYHKYAVDGDGDGNIDIWNSMPDVFASIASYLSMEGWNGELRWGRAVQAPATISEVMYGRDKMQPLSVWRRLGVKMENGSPLKAPADGTDPMAALVAPDGVGDETYLVYDNYNVIMHWNRSTYFATSVGLLAEAIAAAGSD